MAAREDLGPAVLRCEVIYRPNRGDPERAAGAGHAAIAVVGMQRLCCFPRMNIDRDVGRQQARCIQNGVNEFENGLMSNQLSGRWRLAQKRVQPRTAETLEVVAAERCASKVRREFSEIRALAWVPN